MTDVARVFTYEEAIEMLPAVRALTGLAISRIEAIVNRLQSPEEMAERRGEIQGVIEEVVGRWSEEIEALGCQTKGMWLVDWDNGAGYYCWQYPEETIGYFHDYEAGFAGRVPVN